MITLKRNDKDIVDTRTGEEQFVYMKIPKVIFGKIKIPAVPATATTPAVPATIVNGYRAPIEYYFYREVNTVDPNGNPIIVTKKIPLPKVEDTVFTQAEAQGIEQMMGGLTGTYHTERFLQLILGAISYQLSATQPYLTGTSGWTVQP
jgi:hypothetical protein